MKAIIIAAGMGSRLSPLTRSLPKCMLQFKGKSLLERQLEVFKAVNIKNIILIKGYRKEKIDYPKIKYYINDDYENNNILNSLFYAEQEIVGDVIVSYSDILFKRSVLEKLLTSKNDISIVVDRDWKESYKGRKYHPQEEAEKVILDANNNVLEIGKVLSKNHAVSGEFIGLMKLSSSGSGIFREHFKRVKKIYWGKPFQKAAIFQKAYLTDMIQEMLDCGAKINSVVIEGGWREIDTIEDYEKALKELGQCSESHD
ncbi:MAG: phosphocholine cytidylyltransferase family protein [Candidatus Omnitrophica bacterium]|nr:phosphocholine cytidylyltransferase family protein [Candidatus Omnitrophota bacterium]